MPNDPLLDFIGNMHGGADRPVNPREAREAERNAEILRRAEWRAAWTGYINEQPEDASDAPLDPAELKAYREAAGFNEGDLAEVTGVSAATVRAAERRITVGDKEQFINVGIMEGPLKRFVQAAKAAAERSGGEQA